MRGVPLPRTCRALPYRREGYVCLREESGAIVQNSEIDLRLAEPLAAMADATEDDSTAMAIAGARSRVH